MTVSAALEDFDATAFKDELGDYLQCERPVCAIDLDISAASVRACEGSTGAHPPHERRARR